MTISIKMTDKLNFKHDRMFCFPWQTAKKIHYASLRENNKQNKRSQLRPYSCLRCMPHARLTKARIAIDVHQPTTTPGPHEEEPLN
jgi:hypothetical protein